MSTVLVADDAPDVRLLLKHILLRSNFHVEEVESGPELIRHLNQSSAPDLILLDVQMPGMDGFQTLSAIRKHQAAQSVPVILCTVKSNSADVKQAWELGADGFISKPFSLNEVTDTVEAVLERDHEQRISLRKLRLSELEDGA